MTDLDDFLPHAQAAFMEWIKLVEFEVSTANDRLNDAEQAAYQGDNRAFGVNIGAGHGHVQRALQLLRQATTSGFSEHKQ